TASVLSAVQTVAGGEPRRRRVSATLASACGGLRPDSIVKPASSTNCTAARADPSSSGSANPHDTTTARRGKPSARRIERRSDERAESPDGQSPPSIVASARTSIVFPAPARTPARVQAFEPISMPVVLAMAVRRIFRPGGAGPLYLHSDI